MFNFLFKEPTLHLVLPFVKRFKQVCEMKFSDLEPVKQIKLALAAEPDEKL